MAKINYSNRISSLDIMRGIAILLMIEAHIKISADFLGIKNSIGVLAAPFFLAVAGIGYQLFLESRMKRYSKQIIVFMETFWRAIILILITTGLFVIGTMCFPIINSMFYSPDGVFKWSVFQVIGIGYIFGFFIRNSNLKKILSIIGIFILSFIINNFQIESLYFLTKGVLPLIPYLAFFILGQLFYEIYKENNFSLEKNKDLITYSLIFLIFNVIILCVFHYEFTRGNRNYFPEFLMISSIFLLTNLAIIRWADLKNRFKKIFNPFENVGRIAFTAYYLQLIIQAFPYYSMFNSAPYIANITILIIAFMALALFEKKWRNYGYILGLEWILRKGTTILMENITFKIFKSK